MYKVFFVKSESILRIQTILLRYVSFKVVLAWNTAAVLDDLLKAMSMQYTRLISKKEFEPQVKQLSIQHYHNIIWLHNTHQKVFSAIL